MDYRIHDSTYLEGALLAGAGPSMQLYKDGSLQGKGVNCIPIFARPAYLDGTIPGDMVRPLRRSILTIESACPARMWRRLHVQRPAARALKVCGHLVTLRFLVLVWCLRDLPPSLSLSLSLPLPLSLPPSLPISISLSSLLSLCMRARPPVVSCVGARATGLRPHGHRQLGRAQHELPA